jgi:WXG100 family type VII secretion target
MAEIRVETLDVAALATIAAGVATTVQQSVDVLAGEVSMVIGQNWLGEDAAAFDGGFGEWRRGARQVAEALATMATLLDRAASTYETTDAAVAGKAAVESAAP